MPKKRTKKATSKKTTKKSSDSEVSKEILKNLIELQKVHTGLAEKFDKLAKEISSLLSLFEITARSFANSPEVKQSEKDVEFLSKIDKLLDQNKTIAKGLTLMEGRIRGRMYGHDKEEEEGEDELDEEDKVKKKPSGDNHPSPKF